MAVASQPTTITVTGRTPQENYDIQVGRGLVSTLPQHFNEVVRKVLIIHAPPLRSAADTIRQILDGVGLIAVTAEVPDTEEAKHLQVAGFCWQVLGNNDFTRSDAVVSVGGGAVTDLAGFVAATWLRGVSVFHLPTSLLAMVDAAVGGKTGINTAEGKNLVGAFYAPQRVFVDLDFLKTLPHTELINGMAEVVKAGFVVDPKIIEQIDGSLSAADAAVREESGRQDSALPPELTDPDSEVLEDLVIRAIRVKADVVSEDFTEQGRREILNYGHTLGHAIELAERYRFRHGAAVSIGMVFAAELAQIVGRLEEDAVRKHRDILAALGLPITYRSDRWEALLQGMRRDKKARGDLLRFVILDGIGQPAILDVPDISLLFAAYQELIPG